MQPIFEPVTFTFAFSTNDVRSPGLANLSCVLLRYAFPLSFLLRLLHLLFFLSISIIQQPLSLYHSLSLSLSLRIHSKYYFCSTLLQSTVFIEHCSIPLGLHTTTFFLPLIHPSYLQHSPTLLLGIPSVRPT